MLTPQVLSSFSIELYFVIAGSGSGKLYANMLSVKQQNRKPACQRVRKASNDQKLSPERRAEIARKGAEIRWGNENLGRQIPIISL